MTKNLTIWLINLLFLAMVSVGIRDFFLTMSYNEAYISSNFGSGGLTYFNSYPLLLALLFGLTVFLPPISVIIVLLFRRKIAVQIMAYALMAMVILDVYTFCFRSRWQLLGERMAINDLVILGIFLLYYIYFLQLKRRDVLK